MLPPDIVRAVLAMAAARVKQRKISRKLGIARSTVQRVLKGDGRHAAAAAVSADVVPDADPDYGGKPRRCPGGCGRLVELGEGEENCLACRTEAQPRAGRRLRDVVVKGLRVPLELEPEHQARYEEVRAGRLARQAGFLADESGDDEAGGGEPTDDQLRSIEADDPDA